MSVLNLWVGAPTHEGFWVRGRVEGEAVRLAVSTSSDLSTPAYFGPVTPTDRGVASIAATGLDSRTEYHWAFEVDGVLDLNWQGRTRTAPVAGDAVSFRFTAAGDSGHLLNRSEYQSGYTSNHPSISSIAAAPADFYIMPGDLHYADIGLGGISAAECLDRQHAAIDNVLTFNGTLGADARWGQFLRSVPFLWTPDDHDFAGDDSHGGSNGAAQFQQMYRERVPHPPLPDAAAVYFSYTHGRLRFVVTDTRSEASAPSAPDGPDKHVLGPTQEQWFKDELIAARDAGEFVCWVNSRPWLDPVVGSFGTDRWNKYDTQRQRLASFIVDNGMSERMFSISADFHGLAMAEGRHNLFGGFPVIHAASIDANPSTGMSAGGWKWGPQAGKGQWVAFDVEDSGGDSLTVSATGMQDEAVWETMTFTLGDQTPPGPPAPPGFQVMSGLYAIGAAGQPSPAYVRT